VILMLGITVLGGILRGWNLGEKSFWIDELLSLCHAESIHNVASFLTPSCGNAHPPLFFLLLKGWAAFGEGEVFLRSLPVIFGVAVIPALFLLGRELLGERTATVAAFFVAISPFHLLYDRELRMYSLLTLLTVLSLYFFLKALRTGRSSHWAMYTVLSTMNVYVHYHAFLVILFEWVFYFAWYAKYLKLWGKAALSQVIIAACFVWWLPGFLFQIRNPALFALDAPDKFPVAVAGWLVKPLYILYSFSLGQTILPWNIVAIAGSVVIAGIALLGVRKLTEHRDALIFVGLYLCVPVTVGMLVSLSMPRYYLFLAPVYSLVLAQGILCVSRPLVRAGVLMVAIIPMVVSTTNYFHNREFHILAQVDPWREVGAYIRENAQPDDYLVAIGSWRPLGYYLDGFAGFSKPICGTDFEDCVKLMDQTNGHRLWVVGADPALKGETEHARSWFDEHYNRLGDKRFYRDPDYEMKRKLFRKQFLEYRIAVYLYGKA
jgi:4-amino-4-deoxy-L-arabinose transferase-like glycosyltransferase